MKKLGLIFPVDIYYHGVCRKVDCEEMSTQMAQNGRNKNEIVPLTLLKQVGDVFGLTTKTLCLIDGNKGSYELR